jgi:hypothetical protein
MNSTERKSVIEAPIEEFAHCHMGIFRQLDSLGELGPLLDAANRARAIADRALAFFREAIFEHHLDEERELFPAVLHSAEKGDELERVRGITNRLIEEHRNLEATWKRLEPGLRKFVRGHDADFDAGDIDRLVQHYRAHAQYEETVFLPLAKTILSRKSYDLSALGLSLHMRHAPNSMPSYI